MIFSFLQMFLYELLPRVSGSGRWDIPTTTIFSWESGNKIFFAGLQAGLRHFGVTSPIMACAMIMPMVPVTISGFFTYCTMAFSPEAPRLAPDFSIWVVAMALVPSATISMVSSKAFLSLLIIALPIPSPWPSMTQICFTFKAYEFLRCFYAAALTPSLGLSFLW